jgi:hypothetical protein
MTTTPNMKLKHIARLTILIWVLASCKREEATTWRANVLGPIAHGRLSLNDLVADSMLYADEECLWHLTLQNNLTNFNIDSLVDIPDTLIEKIFDMPIIGGPFIIPNNTTLVEEEENNLLKINGAQLKEILVKSGKLHYKIKSYINGYLLCTYSMPGVTYNGLPAIIETTTAPSVGNTPFEFEGEIDLADYHIDLTGESGFMYNKIYSHLIIKTDPNSPAQAQVYGDDYVVIELEFIEPKVKYARGYFGNSTYTIIETVTFGEDMNLPEGALVLSKANAQLTITNYVGADVTLNINQLSAINTTNNAAVNLQYPPLFDAINIERAYDNNGNVQPNVYSFALNENNSNVENFISNLPNQLNLGAQLELNPIGDVSDGHDFLYTSNTLDATLDVDIPLAAGMHNLTLSDTLDIESTLDIDASGELQLYITNAFPFAATVNAWLVDENGNTINELINQQTITSAAETMVEGETLPAKSEITINASQGTINNFSTNHKVVLEVKLNTPNYPAVAKLFKNYYMDFALVYNGDALIGFE